MNTQNSKDGSFWKKNNQEKTILSVVDYSKQMISSPNIKGDDIIVTEVPFGVRMYFIVGNLSNQQKYGKYSSIEKALSKSLDVRSASSKIFFIDMRDYTYLIDDIQQKRVIAPVETESGYLEGLVDGASVLNIIEEYEDPLIESYQRNEDIYIGELFRDFFFKLGIDLDETTEGETHLTEKEARSIINEMENDLENEYLYNEDLFFGEVFEDFLQHIGITLISDEMDKMPEEKIVPKSKIPVITRKDGKVFLKKKKDKSFDEDAKYLCYHCGMPTTLREMRGVEFEIDELMGPEEWQSTQDNLPDPPEERERDKPYVHKTEKFGREIEVVNVCKKCFNTAEKKSYEKSPDEDERHEEYISKILEVYSDLSEEEKSNNPVLCLAPKPIAQHIIAFGISEIPYTFYISNKRGNMSAISLGEKKVERKLKDRYIKEILKTYNNLTESEKQEELVLSFVPESIADDLIEFELQEIPYTLSITDQQGDLVAISLGKPLDSNIKHKCWICGKVVELAELQSVDEETSDLREEDWELVQDEFPKTKNPQKNPYVHNVNNYEILNICESCFSNSYKKMIKKYKNSFDLESKLETLTRVKWIGDSTARELLETFGFEGIKNATKDDLMKIVDKRVDIGKLKSVVSKQ